MDRGWGHQSGGSSGQGPTEAEVRRVLSNFRIPAAADGADLKENLRLWAHTVASAVR